MYTIKSLSSEGEYYLVNGWNKHKTYWVEKSNLTNTMLFSSARDAKRSLTMLLKVMDEYRSDTFSVVNVDLKAGSITELYGYRPAGVVSRLNSSSNATYNLEITDDFESILICAVRYAYGRATYMPSVVCSYIIPLVHKLSSKSLSVIFRDIGGYMDLADDINKVEWNRLYTTIANELNKRK